jgi:insertion element IS1 protein InsB
VEFCRAYRSATLVVACHRAPEWYGIILFLGSHEDEVFLQLKALLAPFHIVRFYTDDWGAYQRHIPSAQHEIGKDNTQKIERTHLTLRTRIKRLSRKTICFSKSIQMHDIVLGLFINRYAFGLQI